MNIIDIVMINIYNYALEEKSDYNVMYENLCNDITNYINEIIINNYFSLESKKTAQLIMHFLSIELNIDSFILKEQQIMDYIINDENLNKEEKQEEMKISNKIIKIYGKINQEQLIIDILNKIDINKKIKSR